MQRVLEQAFVPVSRQRLIERLTEAAKFPVTLLIAPAGFGKSVLLRQYLDELETPYVRFSLRVEHATLLSFLRGFTEALRAVATHAETALADAYERNQNSPRLSEDLAQWMDAHLESFAGTIAVDDLHAADSDPEVARFLTALIERTKAKIAWIIASRSTSALPVASWVAYRDADLQIDEHDLRFTAPEALAAARELRLAINESEVAELLELTEGWPAAMSFALRSSTKSADLRSVSAVTREMTYRFLAEQVYAGLSAEEREFLDVAVALPSIDVEVLERAGFDRALQIVERLRERTAFIYEDARGVYQCHDLFREFLRHQVALAGKHAQERVLQRAARALEEAADIEHAIPTYLQAGLPAEALRLLERHGFELLERARSDVVARAVEALVENTRRDNAAVLALQGALQATQGKFTRAESLFRRALSRASGNPDLVARTSLRLALIVANQGRDVAPILGPIFADDAFDIAQRGEALSTLAARAARVGDERAAGMVADIEELLQSVEEDAVRAKMLHHLGIVLRKCGEADRARIALQHASDLAHELRLYGLASKTNAVLSNLALHENDDACEQLRYAEIAASAASMGGDCYGLRTALLQMLSAATRRGDSHASLLLEERLRLLVLDEEARHLMAFFRAVRLSWEGRFGDAKVLLSGCWSRLHLDLDRLAAGTQYALALSLDGQCEESGRVVSAMLKVIQSLPAVGCFGSRTVAVSRAYCALAELAARRTISGLRIISAVKSKDLVQRCVREAVEVLALGEQAFRGRCGLGLKGRLSKLESVGYGDVARVIRAAGTSMLSKDAGVAVVPNLTPMEVKILRMLSEGLIAREIADDLGRSVNTVRSHITRAAFKLECSGQFDAVRAARRLGIV